MALVVSGHHSSYAPLQSVQQPNGLTMIGRYARIQEHSAAGAAPAAAAGTSISDNGSVIFGHGNCGGIPHPCPTHLRIIRIPFGPKSPLILSVDQGYRHGRGGGWHLGRSWSDGRRRRWAIGCGPYRWRSLWSGPVRSGSSGHRRGGAVRSGSGTKSSPDVAKWRRWWWRIRDHDGSGGAPRTGRRGGIRAVGGIWQWRSGRAEW